MQPSRRTWMAIGLLICGLGLIIIAGLSEVGLAPSEAPPPPGIAAWQPMTLPAATVTRVDGGAVDLHDLRGKVLILNFWASWCPPCHEEFPELVQLAVDFPDDVVLVAISNDEGKGDLIGFLQTFPEAMRRNLRRSNVIIGWDRSLELTQNTFGIIRLPETIIVDPAGHMVRKVVGAEAWKDGAMATYIAGLLQTRTANTP